MSPDELEELLAGFEERLLAHLGRRLGRRLRGLSVIVGASLEDGGRRLELRVEVSAEGRQIAPLSYEELLAEAIEEAAGWLEARLKKRGGGGAGGGGAAGASGRGRLTGSGDGA